MRPDRLPLLGSVVESGPDDRVFDALLLCGPLVIVLLTVFGRTAATVALATGYLGLVVAYVLYKGLRTGRARGE